MNEEQQPYSPITVLPPAKTPSAPLELKAPRPSEITYAGTRGQFSWFADLLLVAHQEHRVRTSMRALESGTPASRIGAMGEPLSGPRFSDPQTAMERMSMQKSLDRAEYTKRLADDGWGEERFEQWAMTVSNAGPFVPSSGPPLYVSDAFVIAARSRGVLPQLLPTGTLPSAGLSVQTGRLDSGASVAVQVNEGDAASSTDPVSGTVTGNLALVAGKVDLSVQLLERADPAMADVVLAAELGAALAEAVDIELVNGTGTGHTTGLLNVSGTTSISAGTATQVTVIPAIFSALSGASTAAGVRADTVLAHPRRELWLRNSHDSTGVYSPPLEQVLAARIVSVPATPTTMGAGTNQDAIIVLNRDAACSIFISAPRIAVMLDVLSGTLQARVEATSYVALLPRQPKAIGKVTGAGLVSPSFS